jgi:hypothetical protein
MQYDWLKHPDNPNLLIIMRGVSGSGKSYRARELAGEDQDAIISADQFFGDTLEEYTANWSVDKLHAAHRNCQARIRGRMQRQLPLAIVDNTNTRIAEMMPYFDMAVQYDYRVQVHEPTSPLWLNDIEPYLGNKGKYAKELDLAAQRLYEINQQTHGVPLDVIKKQIRRYAYPVNFDTLAACHGRYNK